ncbi:hypothetical protein JTE90_029136 [Oedothorax gibbosus]|uniref:Uncharacterized protein n=1 Tax=Oedothorax gibbosus TaxID=931172 RepID=A0AAV6UIH7_9ARAC|nr:hypothetical protein JTE90_029136 [Oedothorax gibbosus]
MGWGLFYVDDRTLESEFGIQEQRHRIPYYYYFDDGDRYLLSKGLGKGHVGALYMEDQCHLEGQSMLLTDVTGGLLF